MEIILCLVADMEISLPSIIGMVKNMYLSLLLYNHIVHKTHENNNVEGNNNNKNRKSVQQFNLISHQHYSCVLYDV